MPLDWPSPPHGITMEDCQWAFSMYIYYVNVYARFRPPPLALRRKNPVNVEEQQHHSVPTKFEYRGIVELSILVNNEQASRHVGKTRPLC